MGAVAEWVGDAVSDIGGFVEDVVFEPIKQVGQIAESAVREVGQAVESVGREVGKIGQAAINDPVGTIAKIGAIASGQWWALPLVSAGLVIANGGDIGQAALSAGIALVTQQAAQGLTDYLGAGGSAALDMAAKDTASLAAEGLTAGQIAEIITQSYPEIGSSAISQMVEMGVMGIPAAQMAAEIGSQMAIQNLAAATVGNAVGAGGRTALSGGNLNDILTSAGTAGLGTAVGGGTSMGLKEVGAGSTIANAIGKGAGAAAATAAAGKNGTAAFLNSLINTSLSEGGAQVKNMLKNAWNDVTSSVNEYNSQLEKTNQTQAAIAPLEKEARDAEAAVNAELAAYQPVRDKFSDLVNQYDAAKAAGDVTLANSLADQANALIPELNAATNKYNETYDNYEIKLNNYSTAVDNYKAEIAKTDQLKAGYEKNSEQLTSEAKSLSDAAAKVVTMSEPVQNAFAKMYQSGTDVNTALANSDKLNGMSTVAQETFNREIAQNNDTEASFAFANQVNSLDTRQQTAFQTGITTGLNNNTALEVAPIISSYNPNQQQAYLGAVKEGYGKEGADLISAFASFAPEQTTNTPVTSITPTTRDVASGFVKLAPEDQLYYKELVNNSELNMTPEKALQEVQATRKAFEEEQSTDKNIIITGVGQNTSTEPPATGGIYGGGDADPLSSIKSLFGPGATGNLEMPALFAFGTKDQQDQAIQYLDDIITDPETPLEKLEQAKTLAEKVKGSKIAGGGGGGGGTSGTSTTTTAPTTAPTTTTGGGQAGSGETTPTNQTLPDASFTGTGTTGSGTTTTAPKAGATTTTAGTGTGTGGGTGSGIGTGTGSGIGAGSGSGTGGGSGSGTGMGTGAGIGIGIGGSAIAGGTGYAGYQALQGQDQYGGIKNLTPGLTQRMDYTLSGLPIDSAEDTINPMAPVQQFAAGGSAANTYDPYSTKDVSGSGISGSLTPGLSKAQINYILSGLPGSNVSVPGHAEGGEIDGHNPSFFSEGGLGSIENRYVQGEGDGTSDSVAAMLANGEFVIPADVVSKLGNGSNEAGAGILDQFLVEIRKHAHSNGEKLPPESKGPLGYLLDAKRKVKT